MNSCRRPRFLIGGLLLLPTLLLANPTGGTVAAGAATIAGQGTGAVTIHQASNTAIINWQSFSINSGESTSFLQPSANSAALNRVLGGGTSLINGTLSANGQVYLINGNGIIVGPGGVINASAFTASTRDITDADFLSGKLHFTGSSEAGVQNLGTITALGGNVVLIGRTVDNEGTITAPTGTVGLIAANDVLLAQSNSDGSTVTVSPAPVAGNANGKVGVKNGGVITAAAAELKAANGNIYGLAVQNLGTIRATTLSHQGGHIWLTSDSGKVGNAGTLDASATAAGGRGGTITVKSATGAVSHTGQIVAKGGPGGVGGNAEVSGARLQFTGKVDLTASHGTMGNLLLDPTDIDVVTGGGTDITAATVDPSAIVSALDGANVTLTATNSITVDDMIDSSGNTNTGNLILDAQTLLLNAGIVLNGSLSGTAPQVLLGPGARVQNGIDAVAGGGTVTLAGGATYSLTTEIVINKSVDLDGNGASLNGGGNTRVMEVDSGTVTLNNLLFQGGNGVSTGGASAGAANGDGGALLVFGEGSNVNLSITNSTFVGNSASLNGGAIFNDGNVGGSANILVENSTFTGNSANNGSVFFDVAGPSSSATIAMKVDTLAMNSGNGAIYAFSSGGGNASIFINDTILAGNMNGGTESDFVNAGGANLNDGGYNLFGQNNSAGGFVPTGTGDVLLFDGISNELGPLGFYGGLTPTLPLLPTSLAFESGDPAFANAPDQRGFTRGSPANFTGSNTDIGAFEAQIVSLQADPVSVVYGNPPTLTYTITGGTVVSISTLNGTPALITPATNVGFYSEDIGAGNVTAALGYIVDFTAGDLTITPRPVTILPDSGQSKIYGSPDPVLTYTANGLINGDTLTGSPSYVGAGTATAVGSYQTNLGTVASPSGNYTLALSAVAPTFDITPATLFYAADQVTVPLGTTEFPNFTGSVVGFIPGDTEANSTTGSLFFTTPASPGSPQGYYEIDGAGLSANNYVFAQAATNIAALIIGEPPPRGGTPPGNLDSPTTPAETQTAASTPNNPTSQAIAQTTPASNEPSDGTTSFTGGGGSQPQSQGSSAPTVDINVTSISPNESIDSTPPPSSGGGDAMSTSGIDTSAVAQGSSFSPDIGATSVTPGQSITVGGTPGTPTPPVVQAQLNQILGTGALDSLSTALDSATTVSAAPADDSSSTATAASTTGTPDESSPAAGTATASSGGSANAPVITGGMNAEVAPGQTVTLGGGRASAGPPPASVQTAFDQGFSPDSRDSLAKAAGL